MRFLLIIGLVLISCKKSDPAADIAGEYDFTVHSQVWSVVTGSRDTVIHSSGSISKASSHTVKISFAIPADTTIQYPIPGMIYPYINDQGIVSNPDFTNTYYRSYFEGERIGLDSIQFSYGTSTNGNGWSNEVTGKKR